MLELNKIYRVPITCVKPGQTREYTYKLPEPSRTKEPIMVMLLGGLMVLDGNHRYYEALDRGDIHIDIVIHPLYGLGSKDTIIEDFI